MKKLLLILSVFVVTFSAFAAELNPFAYGLRSGVNASNPMQLDIQFSINAPATSVKVYLYEIDGDWEVEVDAHLTVDNRAYKGWIDLSVVPGDLRDGTKNLNWRVDVKGAAVANPTCVKNDVRLYAPTSVDIDNNPENENFGTVFVVEGKPNARGNATYSTYLSYKDGAGLYIFNADGTERPMPNRVGQYGYNGGRVEQTRQYFNGSTSGGFAPYRVRVSDDGRIFISSMTPDGEVLWEADPLVFSRPDAPDWETRAGAGWSHVMSSKNANTVMGTTKRNCSHADCGIYHLYQNDAGGPFIAGPNMGFDVRGSGKDFKLLMLAGCKQAIVHSTPAHFYCDEYDLGTARLWNTPPSRRIFAGHSNGINIVNAYGVQVQYDKSGNVWMCQHRAGTTETTLARVNRAIAATQEDKDHNITGGHLEDPESTGTYRRCGAIRFNEDFTQVVIASNANPTAGNNQGGGFTVYPVDQSTGLPIWNSGTQVNTNSKTGYSLMDFAWDYAGNLYIAADASTNGERIAVYAMPHTADKVVSTPAASKYTFSVDCQPGETYDVTTICDPSEAGTITCRLGNNARAAGVLTDIPSCTELTVTAVPEDGYKFINWTDGEKNIVSTNPEYTFFVTRDITLKANFEYATYNVTWHKLLNNTNDLNASGDLDNLEELWYLITTYFNDYNVKHNAASGAKIRSRTQFSNGLSAIQTFFATGYVDTYIEGFLTNSTGKNYLTFTWLGDYINSVKSQTTSASGYYYWLSHFFAGYKEWYLYNNPSQWLPDYWEGVCDLPSQIKYSDNLPIEIKEISPGKSEITNSTVLTRTPYPTWYTRNYQEGKLLAWRDGSTTGNIVHHVSRPDMQLYATYVDKALQEDDPTPDLSKNPYDATNNDVLSLLNNKNYGATAHNVTMDRKFAGGMYNTICLPFDLPITHLPAKLQGADIRVFNGVTETYTESGDPVAVLNFITLDEYWDNWNAANPDNQVAAANRYIEAGKPYLIKPVEDVDDAYLTYSGLPYWRFFDGTRTPYGKYANGVTFQGVLNPTTLPENAYILVANDRLAKVTDTSEKIKGYRGYFVINDIMLRTLADQGNVYFSFKKPVTTSIPVAPEAEQQAQPKVRKVMYDGQIYILRGEEVYTITGHRVK